MNLEGIFGVMDGHGGEFTASFIKSSLPSFIEEAFSLVKEDRYTDDAIRNALLRAFATTETNLKNQPRMRVEVKRITRGTDTVLKINPVIDKVSYLFYWNPLSYSP